MAKYNTRNPVGSTDPRDLYDNASNLDKLVNGEEPFVQDRLGKQRESWSGMEYNFNAAQDGREAAFQASQDDKEDRFQQFLLSSGYVSLGDYAAGITFEARNEYVVYEGQFYRPAAATDLPYTTAGDWGEDGPAMVLLGDDVLRQELASQGGDMVGVTTSSGNQSLNEALEARSFFSSINILSVGAVPGDESFDNTPLIQEAVNDLFEKYGGGEVVVPEGEFHLHSPVYLKSNITIRGEGHGSKLTGNNAFWSSAERAILFAIRQSDTLPYAGPYENITIADLSVTAYVDSVKKRGSSAIHIQYCNGVFIERVYVREGSDANIRVDGYGEGEFVDDPESPFWGNSRNVWIKDNICENGFLGIELEGGVEKAYISGNTIKGSLSHDIRLPSAYSAIISGNSCHGALGSCVYLARCKNILVENNHFNQDPSITRTVGIGEDVDGVVITGNHFKNGRVQGLSDIEVTGTAVNIWIFNNVFENASRTSAPPYGLLNQEDITAFNNLVYLVSGERFVDSEDVPYTSMSKLRLTGGSDLSDNSEGDSLAASLFRTKDNGEGVWPFNGFGNLALKSRSGEGNTRGVAIFSSLTGSPYLAGAYLGRGARIVSDNSTTDSVNRSAAIAAELSQATGAQSAVIASTSSQTSLGQSVLVGSSRTIASVGNSLTLGHSSSGSPSSNNQTIRLEAVGGVGRFSGDITTSGLDYAELFPNALGEEIPPGTIISLSENGVMPASHTDDICGVISHTYGILGGDHFSCWAGRYLKDDWGRQLWESVEDPDNPGSMIERRVENPDYIPEKQQLSRLSRPDEWSPVGLLGQVLVRVDHTIKPGIRIGVGSNPGIGTAFEERTGLRCIRVIKPGIALCLVNIRV